VIARLTSRDRLSVLGRQVYQRVLRTLNRWAGLLRPAPSVALLAPDGAGKSTLAAGVQNSFFPPVRSVYMGLYQKTTAEAARSRGRRMGFVRHLFTQWRRYLIARYHQARGRLVIFDRYTYDALLPPRHKLSGLGRLRRWLLARACPPPDLVLMLDAPGEVLYARKGEHTADILEQQRQQYLALRPYLPQMVVVDASQDAERVRREAVAVIWRTYTARSA
jgi:thymidylate kinase